MQHILIHANVSMGEFLDLEDISWQDLIKKTKQKKTWAFKFYKQLNLQLLYSLIANSSSIPYTNCWYLQAKQVLEFNS